MEKVSIKINGETVSVSAGSSILEAVKNAGFSIPSLCWLKETNEIGACRMCVVEVDGADELVTSCITKVREGMNILTNSSKVIESRKNTLKLILSNHEKKCLSCIRNEKCELQALCREYGIEDDCYYEGEVLEQKIDESSPYIVRESSKCILCRRCISVCKNLQTIGVIGTNGRGFESSIGTAFELGLGSTSCVGCGQCVTVCPTGALYEKDRTQEVFDVLEDKDKYVVVQTAPSVRAALGECFGLPVGTDTEGKMVTALRKLGFDRVFDTNFAADLTIMEEANELVERINNKGKLPMITSCSPGWINYCEHYYPEMIENLSTCKSPQQMFGAVTKTYYAEKINIKPENIIVVSIMPCTAKKGEIGRNNQAASGYPDVDISLTTRELGRMIEKSGIDFLELQNSEFDEPLGISTGAGAIFGATGGVMEAALRTAVETITGEKLKTLEFEDIRGMEGVKEASYKAGNIEINVAVASGLSNAKKLIKEVKKGTKEYHFIEIMACPGGCINGGGQPQQPSNVINFTDIGKKRAEVLYKIDENRVARKSHENPAIKELYKSYLEKPGSKKAHNILHTSYQKEEIHKL